MAPSCVGCEDSVSSCPGRITDDRVCLCRLYDMGVITTKKSLVQLEQLSTASFCRRRLSVVMVRLKMSETLREACTFIEQGHVRVGPDTVTDPAFLVSPVELRGSFYGAVFACNGGMLPRPWLDVHAGQGLTSSVTYACRSRAQWRTL